LAEVKDELLSPTVLYIFAGLPGSGKTTLSKMLARKLKATYLRIDTVEQGLRDLCAIDVHGEGYRLAYRLAGDNLRLRVNVVADSCNPIDLTRHEWQDVALKARAQYVNIEIVCSDPVEHRRRIESREASVEGLRLPTWQEVENRDYSRWSTHRLVIDTAGRTEEECFNELVSLLAPGEGQGQT
jgi:predicted kinase